MGGNHGPAAPSPRGAVRATLAVVIPLAVVTLAALIWMWPDAPKPADQPRAEVTRMTGTIVRIDFKPCPKQVTADEAPLDVREPGQAQPGALPPTDPAKCGDAVIELTSGPNSGQTAISHLPSGPGTQKYAMGNKVVLLYTPAIASESTPGDTPESPYQLSDHDRSNPLWLIAAAFALAVIAFGRWRGLTALIGLVITFALLLKFLIPAIIAGQPPLLTAIVCAATIMLAVLYLTHGFTVATSIAVIGTLASLALTGLLAVAAITMTHLNGITDESSFYLDYNYRINTQGLLLASVIIGALGVLDDVTVTQAATVTELAHANPSYTFRQLYRAASRVGRAHIASVINTIILAYAGASLPLLLLFSIGRQPLGEVLTGPIVAQEIVRSIAGTLGLIAAVPITTALAALTRTRPATPDPDRHHAPTGAPTEPVTQPASTPASREGRTARRSRPYDPVPDPDWPPPTWPRTPVQDFRE